VHPVLEVEGQRYSVNADSIVLGRSSEADIVVDDTGVSRRHLEIRRSQGRVYAVDLGSTNGSYVNGERVNGSAELLDGSTITMGRTRIVFRMLPAPLGGIT
jgi:pSer/pThr/pTyr-binding forkhead associated (FHA) protein